MNIHGQETPGDAIRQRDAIERFWRAEWPHCGCRHTARGTRHDAELVLSATEWVPIEFKHRTIEATRHADLKIDCGKIDTLLRHCGVVILLVEWIDDLRALVITADVVKTFERTTVWRNGREGEYPDPGYGIPIRLFQPVGPARKPA